MHLVHTLQVRVVFTLAGPVGHLAELVLNTCHCPSRVTAAVGCHNLVQLGRHYRYIGLSIVFGPSLVLGGLRNIHVVQESFHFILLVRSPCRQILHLEVVIVRGASF